MSSDVLAIGAAMGRRLRYLIPVVVVLAFVLKDRKKPRPGDDA